MKKPEKKDLFIGVAVVFLIAAAISLRYFGRYTSDSTTITLGVLRSAIYIFLMVAWGLSIRVRIIHTQIRRYLLSVSSLIIFWLIIRTVKYHFVSGEDAQRYLWYLYYLPMLFIPLMAVFIALSLGKSENFRLPGLTKLLYIPSVLLFLAVITNDLHQFVFSFPEGSVFSDANSSYAAGYYIIAVWIALCSAAAFITMIFKCRLPKSETFLWLPTVPMLMMIIYGFLYNMKLRWFFLLAGDFTVSVCLLTVAVFESCIDCGLIQSNTGYEALFSVSEIKAQITDESFEPRFSSALARRFSKETLKKASTAALRLDSGTLLKSSKLRNGYVFWQEDISELTKVISELELIQEELRDTGDILKAESEQKAHWLQITEKNRLYDLVEKQTASQVALLRSLLLELKGTDDRKTAQHLLGKIVAVGTYIKRKSNLVFIENQKKSVSVGELRLCLNETAANLKLCGAECRAVLNLENPLCAENANFIYDLFEAVIEKSLDSLSSLLIFAEEDTDLIRINICASCKEDLFCLGESFPGLSVQCDDDGLIYLFAECRKDSDGR